MRKLLLASLAAFGASIGMADAASLQTTKPSTEPGSVTFNLGGLVTFYAGVGSDSGSNYAGGKSSTFRTLSYVRLYPGVDGVLPNGIQWGAQFEVRMNNPASTSGSPGANTNGNTLYARRGFIYFGTPTLGRLRVGPHYGPSGLLLTGNFEGYNDGAWNGDLPGVFNGNSAPSYPLPTTSQLYSSNKIVYMSPSFFGFDAGISYAPSTNAFLGGENCGTAGAGGCAYGSTSPLASESARRKDMIEAGIRYRGTFGPVGLAANASWIHAGHLHTSVPSVAYKTQDLADLGAELSFAGFTVGGNYQVGSYTAGYALVPKGQKDGSAYMVGAQYATGPFVVGASFFSFTNYGNAAATTGTRMDQGFAAGGTYTLTPGVNLYLSYLYGTRRERGYDFLAGAPGGLHNNVKAQAFSLGTTVKW